MTLYGNGNNAPVGGIMSPFQGTTPGVAGGATQQLPAGMSLLEAMSRGLVSRNSLVNTVNGVSTGLGSPTPIGDLCSNGAGQQMNLGVAVPGVAGNPVGNGANDQQVFVDGTSGPAQLANGPTPTCVESLTSGPVSVNTNANSVALVANGFQG